MKDSFYLKHDLDARNDPKLVKLRIKMGAKGYGIYWLVVEKLYSENGRLDRDWKSLSWELHESPDDIKTVVEDFELFYNAEGKIGCRRTDRDLADRREAQRKASEAGRASAEARKIQRAFNDRSTDVQPGEERRGEEGEKRTTAAPPPAIDFSAFRVPFGARKNVYITSLPVDEAQVYLKSPRLSKEFRAALLWRIELKAAEGRGPRSGGIHHISQGGA